MWVTIFSILTHPTKPPHLLVENVKLTMRYFYFIFVLFFVLISVVYRSAVRVCATNPAIVHIDEAVGLYPMVEIIKLFELAIISCPPEKFPVRYIYPPTISQLSYF